MSKLWLEYGLVLCLVECPKGPHEFCDARSVTTTRRVSRNIVTVTLFEAGVWDRSVALLQNGDGSDVVQTSNQYRTSCIVPNSCLNLHYSFFSVLRARFSATRLLVLSRALLPLSSFPLFFFRFLLLLVEPDSSFTIVNISISCNQAARTNTIHAHAVAHFTTSFALSIIYSPTYFNFPRPNRLATFLLRCIYTFPRQPKSHAEFNISFAKFCDQPLKDTGAVRQIPPAPIQQKQGKLLS